MKRRLAVLAATAGWMALSISAHHSFSAEFDSGKAVVLEGVVSKVEWANPHVYFYVDVKEANGGTTTWACETGGPNALIRQGWKHDSMKVGDHVTVNGYLAKDGSKMADARQVKLADGRKVFSGTPDDGGPQNRGR